MQQIIIKKIVITTNVGLISRVFYETSYFVYNKLISIIPCANSILLLKFFLFFNSAMQKIFCCFTGYKKYKYISKSTC